MKHEPTAPYRIGWRTKSSWRRIRSRWSHPLHGWRYYIVPGRLVHRPWQAESEHCQSARRALTGAGAARKIRRDETAELAGRRSLAQRRKLWLSRGWDRMLGVS